MPKMIRRMKLCSGQIQVLNCIATHVVLKFDRANKQRYNSHITFEEKNMEQDLPLQPYMQNLGGHPAFLSPVLYNEKKQKPFR
jgi:hypothetical protein